MNKLRVLLSYDTFWYWFVSTSAVVFLIETLLLGMWAIPIINYQIPYMAERRAIDIAFAISFALLFGFGTALFRVARSYNTATCAVGGGTGLLAFFTLLCPVCPVFFLTWFGLSSTLMAVSPYFAWLRLLSLLVLVVAIGILWLHYTPKKSPRKLDAHRLIQRIAIPVIVVMFLINQLMVMGIAHAMTMENMDQGVKLSGDFAQDVAVLVTPTQLPFYGAELGLDMSSINAINTSIAKLSVMAPQQGSKPIQLTSDEMKRYVAIGTEPYVTCEFCCGVKTLVREDGSPTCGCAHSIAMRGTAAYLIQNYPEMTNAEIAYELMRQKGLYFPTQMQERMASSLAGDKDEFLPDIVYLTMNLSDDELADMKSKAVSSGFTPPTESPNMVGGC